MEVNPNLTDALKAAPEKRTEQKIESVDHLVKNWFQITVSTAEAIRVELQQTSDAIWETINVIKEDVSELKVSLKKLEARFENFQMRGGKWEY